MLKCFTTVFGGGARRGVRSPAAVAAAATSSPLHTSSHTDGKSRKTADDAGATVAGTPGVPIGDVSGAPSIPGYEVCARVSALPPKSLSQYVLTGSHAPVCLVNYGGSVHALHDVCPHKQAQMSLGDIEDSHKEKGVCVKCPRHRKKFNGGLNFNVATGESWVIPPCAGEYNATWSLPVYDVKVEGDFVYVSTAPKGGARSPTAATATAATAAAAAGGLSIGSATSPARSAVAGAATPLSPDVDLHSIQRHDSARGPVPPAEELEWIPCRITKRTMITHDTAIYRVEPQVGIPVPRSSADRHSWHIVLRIIDPDTPDTYVTREYTPVSALDAWDSAREPQLDLLIKHYPRGRLTSRLNCIDSFDGFPLWVSAAETTLRLPHMIPVATAAGSDDASTVAATPYGMIRGGEIALVAGGTGVTPVLQLLKWAVEVAPTLPTISAPIRISVIVSQHTPDDALCTDEFARLAQAAAGSVRLLFLYTRDAKPLLADGEDWKEHPTIPFAWVGRGRVNRDILARFMPVATSPPAGASAASATGTHAVHPLQRAVVSGPAGMFTTVAAELAAAGHPAHVAVELEA